MKQALVVDDHPLVCEALKGLLETHVPFLKVTTSSGGEGVLHEITDGPWAFVVLDMRLPSQSGLNLLKRARTCRPDLPIIVYSAQSERQYASRALSAGAVAYFSKESSPWKLVEIARQILDGRKVSRPIGKRPALSPRERQILTLLANGVSRANISAMLDISDKTVSAHQANLILKLDLRNSMELVRYAIEEGFGEER